LTTSPPGQTRNDPEFGPAFRRAEPCSRSVLFGNPVLVTHESHTRVWWSGSSVFGSSRPHAERVSGNSPLQLSSQTVLPDVTSRGPCQRTLTDLWEKKLGVGRRVARRWAGTIGRASGEIAASQSVAQAFGWGPGASGIPGVRRSDRRGQAPKGAGGMPRRHQNSGVEGCDKSGGAAQRASSPEYPKNPGN
jgi:hypothetical protein